MKRGWTFFALVLFCAVLAFVAHKAYGHKPRHVVLTWDATPSSQSTRITGYNVYRAAKSGGPYTRIASGVKGLKFEDDSVVIGNNYFYVVTSVDLHNRESKYSKEASAAVRDH